VRLDDARSPKKWYATPSRLVEDDKTPGESRRKKKEVWYRIVEYSLT
jgi:hypothetical protein